MVAIFRELAQFNYGGLTFKAISACCVLCMDLIGNPSSVEADDFKKDVSDPQRYAFSHYLPLHPYLARFCRDPPVSSG